MVSTVLFLITWDHVLLIPASGTPLGGAPPGTGSGNPSTESTGAGGLKHAPTNQLGGSIAVIDEHHMTSNTDDMEDQQEAVMEEDENSSPALQTLQEADE